MERSYGADAATIIVAICIIGMLGWLWVKVTKIEKSLKLKFGKTGEEKKINAINGEINLI